MLNLEQTALILDIDGVIRDVSGSYRRALADTVENFAGYRPTALEIDNLKAEGRWNNDWEASQELIRRHTIANPALSISVASYAEIVTFFQARYRGMGDVWDGYITQEPLLVSKNYFAELSGAGVRWGFFSGATRASAEYVLHRLEISGAVLVAMEDAKGKPDPEGLFKSIDQLEQPAQPTQTIETIIYAGDTVADMLTIVNAREQDHKRKYLAVGIIPPHVEPQRCSAYRDTLLQNGADFVFEQLISFNLTTIADII